MTKFIKEKKGIFEIKNNTFNETLIDKKRFTIDEIF